MESAAQSEYKEFIYRYLLQIIGIPLQSKKTIDDIILDVDKYVPSSGYVFDAPDEKRVYFADYSDVLFYVESKADIDNDNINAAVNIVQVFFTISKYRQWFDFAFLDVSITFFPPSLSKLGIKLSKILSSNLKGPS